MQNVVWSAICTALFCTQVTVARQTDEPQDTTQYQKADSARVASGINRFIPAIGSFEQRLDSSAALHSTHFIWTDAKNAGDLLWNVPGFFLRELGEPGEPVQLNGNGIDGRGISVSLDGRPLNDPLTGTYELAEMPIEYVEQIEIVQDSRALFYGPNATGGALNFVTHQYNNNRPLTKFRYLQGPFEHILSDALFAQNVARGTNVMAGFQRQVTDGRFNGASFDSWNVRARVRYNHSERINTWMSYFYNRYVTGFNGGIDLKQSPTIYDEVEAVVQTEAALQTVSRRDFTLGGFAVLFPDSSWTTQARFYYSIIEREYREDYSADSLNFTDLAVSSYWGVKAEQQLRIGFADIAAAFTFEERQIDESKVFFKQREDYLALTARGAFTIAGIAKLSSFLRQEQLRKTNALSYGFKLTTPIGEWLELTGGYSSSYRFLTMQEYYWAASKSLSNERHKRWELGIQLNAHPIFDISITGFSKNIENEIVFLPVQTSGVFPTATPVNLKETSIRGLAGSFTVRLWNFEASGALTYTDHAREDVTTAVFPKIVTRGEFSYRDQFFDGALDGKLGLRATFMSKQDGLQFIPQHLLFVSQSDIKIGAFSTLDLYAVLKLGDAHVLVVWENPLDVNYMITPVYPMPARNFKIGVNWVFTD